MIAQADPTPEQAQPADPSPDKDKNSARATTLVVSPAEATLSADGKTHQSPWRPTFKKRQRSLKVTVSAPQHVSQTITLKPGQGEVKLALAPQPRPVLERLPAGRWRAYSSVLAGPFATLGAVAERLGYPRE